MLNYEELSKIVKQLTDDSNELGKKILSLYEKKEMCCDDTKPFYEAKIEACKLQAKICNSAVIALDKLRETTL